MLPWPSTLSELSPPYDALRTVNLQLLLGRGKSLLLYLSHLSTIRAMRARRSTISFSEDVLRTEIANHWINKVASDGNFHSRRFQPCHTSLYRRIIYFYDLQTNESFRSLSYKTSGTKVATKKAQLVARDNCVRSRLRRCWSPLPLFPPKCFITYYSQAAVAINKHRQPYRFKSRRLLPQPEYHFSANKAPTMNINSCECEAKRKINRLQLTPLRARGSFCATVIPA